MLLFSCCPNAVGQRTGCLNTVNFFYYSTSRRAWHNQKTIQCFPQESVPFQKEPCTFHGFLQEILQSFFRILQVHQQRLNYRNQYNQLSKKDFLLYREFICPSLQNSIPAENVQYRILFFPEAYQYSFCCPLRQIPP